MKKIIVGSSLLLSFGAFSNCPSLEGIYRSCRVTQDLTQSGTSVIVLDNGIEVSAPESISISQGTTPDHREVYNIMTVESVDTFIADGYRRKEASIPLDRSLGASSNDDVTVVTYCSEEHVVIRYSSQGNSGEGVSWDYEGTTRMSKSSSSLVIELVEEKAFLVCSESK